MTLRKAAWFIDGRGEKKGMSENSSLFVHDNKL